MRTRPRGCKNSNGRQNEGLIDLYFGDESHVCTEGYVPYGWQFREEDAFVPSQKFLRLNIFGMIDRDNHSEGFSTIESITADKVADFPDRLSFRIRKDTFLVLDNAKIHRCKLISGLRPVWEKRGLFLFFLPPIFLASEHCGNIVVHTQRQMAQACGLYVHRFHALCYQQSFGGNRD